MPGDDPVREPVPVVGVPAELVHEWRVGERGVRRAAGDDDVGLLLQRLDDRFGAKIGVRSGHPVADRGERGARLHVAQPVSRREEVIERVHEIVARDHGHAGPARERLVREREPQFVPAPLRVHAAGVRYDADLAGDEVLDEVVHEEDEVARVPRLRVPGPLLLHDRHRDLGQVVEHQVVDRAAAHLQLGRLLPVAPEPLPRGHPHRGAAAAPDPSRAGLFRQSYRGRLRLERHRVRHAVGHPPAVTGCRGG